MGHLAAEEVEVLGGGGYVADLDVFVGAELQIPFDSGAGVFGALAFVAVGEEESEAGGFSPLVFGGDYELVDDDLGAVGEVAVLGFPEDEGFGGFDAVAVFEA